LVCEKCLTWQVRTRLPAAPVPKGLLDADRPAHAAVERKLARAAATRPLLVSYGVTSNIAATGGL
jgi:hypothetical protein